MLHAHTHIHTDTQARASSSFFLLALALPFFVLLRLPFFSEKKAQKSIFPLALALPLSRMRSLVLSRALSLSHASKRSN